MPSETHQRVKSRYVINYLHPFVSILNALADLSLQISTFFPIGPHAPQQLDNCQMPSEMHQRVESRYVIDYFHPFVSTLNALADLSLQISTFCPIGPHAPQQPDNCWMPSEAHQGVK